VDRSELVPFDWVAVAVNCWVAPIGTLGFTGVTSTRELVPGEEKGKPNSTVLPPQDRSDPTRAARINSLRNPIFFMRIVFTSDTFSLPDPRFLQSLDHLLYDRHGGGQQGRQAHELNPQILRSSYHFIMKRGRGCKCRVEYWKEEKNDDFNGEREARDGGKSPVAYSFTEEYFSIIGLSVTDKLKPNPNLLADE